MSNHSVKKEFAKIISNLRGATHAHFHFHGEVLGSRRSWLTVMANKPDRGRDSMVQNVQDWSSIKPDLEQ